MARWRQLAGATALATLATTGIAAAVGAGPVEPARAARQHVVAAGASRAVEGPRPLPAVTEHAIDPALLAAHRQVPPAGSHVVQEVRVAVTGGSLALETPDAVVQMHKVPGSANDWRGELPPVRVIDARGTHRGWDLRWHVDGVDVQGSTHPVPEALLKLEPGVPVVVAGLPDGLVAGRPGPGVRKGRTLLSAAQGSGGGTYEAGGTVSVRLPKSVDANGMTVAFAFTIG